MPAPHPAFGLRVQSPCRAGDRASIALLGSGAACAALTSYYVHLANEGKEHQAPTRVGAPAASPSVPHCDSTSLLTSRHRASSLSRRTWAEPGALRRHPRILLPPFTAPCSPHVLSGAPVPVLASQEGEGSTWMLPLSSFYLPPSQQAHWHTGTPGESMTRGLAAKVPSNTICAQLAALVPIHYSSFRPCRQATFRSTQLRARLVRGDSYRVRIATG